MIKLYVKHTKYKHLASKEHEKRTLGVFVKVLGPPKPSLFRAHALRSPPLAPKWPSQALLGCPQDRSGTAPGQTYEAVQRKSQNILSIIFLRFVFFHYVYNINAFWSVFKKSLKNHCFLYHNCIIGSQSYRCDFGFCADLTLFVERIVFFHFFCYFCL